MVGELSYKLLLERSVARCSRHCHGNWPTIRPSGRRTGHGGLPRSVGRSRRCLPSARCAKEDAVSRPALLTETARFCWKETRRTRQARVESAPWAHRDSSSSTRPTESLSPSNRQKSGVIHPVCSRSPGKKPRLNSERSCRRSAATARPTPWPALPPRGRAAWTTCWLSSSRHTDPPIFSRCHPSPTG